MLRINPTLLSACSTTYQEDADERLTQALKAKPKDSRCDGNFVNTSVRSASDPEIREARSWSTVATESHNFGHELPCNVPLKIRRGELC